MPILAGIDGTGTAVVPGAGRDRDYDEAFKNSFVTRLCRNKTYAGYWRGPVALGGGLMGAINGAVQYIMDRRRTEPNADVLLTGYSRGAAGVVVVAKRLQSRNVPVKAMLLFDCVDRHLFTDASVVPSNVENLCHVIRSSRSGSRESFSNDGMSYIPPTRIYRDHALAFMCTHGGMGGTPWDHVKDGKRLSDKIDEGFPDGLTNITYEQDIAGSQLVWNNVLPFINLYGFRQ